MHVSHEGNQDRSTQATKWLLVEQKEDKFKTCVLLEVEESNQLKSTKIWT